MKEKKGRIVHKPSIARKLVKLGFQIIDLKPQKDKDGNVDYTKTDFVFADREGLLYAIGTFANAKVHEKVEVQKNAN